MKSIIYWILIVAACALGIFSISCSRGGTSSPSQQTPAFYVDAVNGKDSNAGTDPSNPWQSLAKVSASSIPFGSTVYLKRGSVWHEQLTIPSSGITIDAYGTGPHPVIDGSTEITGWTDQGSGLYSSPTITLGLDEALGNLSENDVMMSFLTWTTNATTTFSTANPGSYSYDYPSTMYIKPASSPLGNAYRASVKLYGVTATSKHDIIVKNLEITRFSLHGVHFKDCVRCTVYNSIISKGGGAVIATAPTIYAGNGIEFGNASSNGVVDGVTVSEIFDSGITPQTYMSSKAMSSISIRNSEVSKCGLAGIEVSVLSSGGTATGSSINNVVISGMTVTGSGHGWSGRRYGIEGHGIRIKADGDDAGTVSGVQLDTTSIYGSIGDGVMLDGEIGTVRMHRMNIMYNTNGISLLEESAMPTAKVQLTSSLVHHNTNYGIYYYSLSAAGFELYQNTLSDNTGINMAVFDWGGSGTATAKIQNNIFFGSSPMTHLYSAPTLTNATIDNNCYNEFVNELVNIFGYGVNAYSTVSAFRAATNFETNGIGGIVGLSDPVAGNFFLSVSSVCRTLGNSSVGVTDDYSGYPFSVPPSSGAHQYR